MYCNYERYFFFLEMILFKQFLMIFIYNIQFLFLSHLYNIWLKFSLITMQTVRLFSNLLSEKLF